MDMTFYMRDPRLWEYFISLPSPVRAALLYSRVLEEDGGMSGEVGSQ